MNQGSLAGRPRVAYGGGEHRRMGQYGPRIGGVGRAIGGVPQRNATTDLQAAPEPQQTETTPAALTRQQRVELAKKDGSFAGIREQFNQAGSASGRSMDESGNITEPAPAPMSADEMTHTTQGMRDAQNGVLERGTQGTSLYNGSIDSHPTNASVIYKNGASILPNADGSASLRSPYGKGGVTYHQPGMPNPPVSKIAGQPTQQFFQQAANQSREENAYAKPEPRPVKGNPQIAARAKGGPVKAGRPYLVGERGPELVIPRKDGLVIPNDVIAPRAKSGGKADAKELNDRAAWFVREARRQMGRKD